MAESLENPGITAKRIQEKLHPGSTQSVHWMAILNSFLLILIIACMLFSVIVRSVRNDLAEAIGEKLGQKYSMDLEMAGARGGGSFRGFCRDVR